jgi:hypothetical protein
MEKQEKKKFVKKQRDPFLAKRGQLVLPFSVVYGACDLAKEIFAQGMLVLRTFFDRDKKQISYLVCCDLFDPVPYGEPIPFYQTVIKNGKLDGFKKMPKGYSKEDNNININVNTEAEVEKEE